jgi:hypothetical protein
VDEKALKKAHMDVNLLVFTCVPLLMKIVSDRLQKSSEMLFTVAQIQVGGSILALGAQSFLEERSRKLREEKERRANWKAFQKKSAVKAANLKAIAEESSSSSEGPARQSSSSSSETEDEKEATFAQALLTSASGPVVDEDRSPPGSPPPGSVVGSVASLSSVGAASARSSRPTDASLDEGKKEVDLRQLGEEVKTKNRRRASVIQETADEDRRRAESRARSLVEWYRYSCVWHILKETLKGVCCRKTIFGHFLSISPFY